jgi:hypothetical protein
MLLFPASGRFSVPAGSEGLAGTGFFAPTPLYLSACRVSLQGSALRQYQRGIAEALTLSVPPQSKKPLNILERPLPSISKCLRPHDRLYKLQTSLPVTSGLVGFLPPSEMICESFSGRSSRIGLPYSPFNRALNVAISAPAANLRTFGHLSRSQSLQTLGSTYHD